MKHTFPPWLLAGLGPRRLAAPLMCCLSLGGSLAMADTPTPGLVCRHADGRTVVIGPSEAPQGTCRAASLPVRLDEVRWAHWLPQPPASGEGGLLIEGAGRGDSFKPVTARFRTAPAEKPRADALPIGRPLFGEIVSWAFGVEERVTVEPGSDGLAIVCRAGRKPAGVVLDPRGRRFPQSAEIVVRIVTRGDAMFGFGLAPRNTTPAAFQSLTPGTAMDIPVPDDRTLREEPWLVLACPEQGGNVVIDDLLIAPAKSRPRLRMRSAWAWDPSLWRDRPGDLEAAYRLHALDRLFVSVEIARGVVQDEARLARFIGHAKRAGRDVMAVEGDPAMALPSGRSGAIDRLKALAAYQRRAPVEARLAGVQYDIEPYLLPSFGGEPAAILQGWAETVDELGRNAGSLKLDMALPFWLRGTDGAEKTILPAVRRAAASLTIMAYRTREDELMTAAEPLLGWGAAAGLPVHVALEMGRLEDEVSRFFMPGADGDVVVIPHAGGSLLLLLRHGWTGTAASAFQLERETVASADRVSFLGDREEMERLATRAASVFQAWPTFAGVAFHGLVE